MKVPQPISATISSLRGQVRKQLGVAVHALARHLDTPSPLDQPRTLDQVTRSIGDDWKVSGYYDQAEPDMDKAWNGLLWPLLEGCDFSVVVDLAAGHGRNSEKLRQHAKQIYVVDINQENIDFCRNRFAGDPRFTYIRCDGLTLAGIPDRSVSLLYCFDSMVHFDSDTVRAYLKEFRRILKPGGRGLCHHSNFTGRPVGDYHESPHTRNFMSRELFEHYCDKEGLRVVRSRLVDWNGDATYTPASEHAANPTDCIGIFDPR